MYVLLANGWMDKVGALSEVVVESEQDQDPEAKLNIPFEVVL